MTHDYKRNGTTTLFAALNMVDGKVIGTACRATGIANSCAFSRLIDHRDSADLDLPSHRRQLRHPQNPSREALAKAASALPSALHADLGSWLNMVERFFAEITRNRIRRGTFKSVAELKSAILEYLENHNADPKPFVWTKSAGEILE